MPVSKSTAATAGRSCHACYHETPIPGEAAQLAEIVGAKDRVTMGLVHSANRKAEMLHELGVVDRSLPFADLKRHAHINDRVRSDNASEDFSELSRVGLRK